MIIICYFLLASLHQTSELKIMFSDCLPAGVPREVLKCPTQAINYLCLLSLYPLFGKLSKLEPEFVLCNIALEEERSIVMNLNELLIEERVKTQPTLLASSI